MKNVKVNFALAMIIIVIIVMAAIFCAASAGSLNKSLDGTVKELDEERLSDDEIDDVEGYGYILSYLGVGAGRMAEIVLWVMAVIAGFYAVLLFVFALAARMIFSAGKRRLLAYRILMGIEYALQGVLVFQLVVALLDGFSAFLFGVTVILILDIVYSAVNTYSKRIICQK